jgi:hypothetical protein
MRRGASSYLRSSFSVGKTAAVFSQRGGTGCDGMLRCPAFHLEQNQIEMLSGGVVTAFAMTLMAVCPRDAGWPEQTGKAVDQAMDRTGEELKK